ncbi:MAG: bifunctional 4-hydroxy-2-oxoglutarate aldolase/2-dehydro-3-deoxy-phosphogluconate aldolase [Alphaproteobacteria bacterium]|nr:MAG: bifunctional 4-hydroxy-2-oxoglutarate aldolase/2-dehydro-3-deoxy-phosphogluconate aldolase [Alphaproteobacteria bacterium]
MTNQSAIRAILARGAVMPILTIEDADSAAPIARALVAGGVMTFEVVLRTPAALDAVRAMIAAVPEASVGVGTLLTADQVAAAAAAGAAFGVSPGLTPALAAAVTAHRLPFLPGVQTASEVMLAREAGFLAQKLFPASVVGGLAWLDSLAPVFADVVFCPTGGIRADDIPDYLARPNCVTVGGSWVVPKALVAARDWAGIEALARRASAFRKA